MKWKPSKSAARDFTKKMEQIHDFCRENGIMVSTSGDSYYFALNGQSYRVSNHTVEHSNMAAYDEITGEQVRDLYHPDGRRTDTVYIHAGKSRIMEIYNNLKAGVKLDGKGYPIYL